MNALKSFEKPTMIEIPAMKQASKSFYISGLALILGGALLSGCNPNNLKADQPDAVAQSVEVRTGDQPDQMIYDGPKLTFSGSNEDHEETADVTLRARTTPKEGTRYFLEAESRYEGHWRNYIRAIDDRGRSFQGYSIYHHPRCELFCTYEDNVEIEVDAAYIRAHQQSGLIFYLLGPAAKSPVALTIPPGYLKGFLEKVPLPTPPKK
jgi:hypothetical protein